MNNLEKEQSAKFNFWNKYESLDNKEERMDLVSKMASNVISAAFFKGDFRQKSRRVREELVEKFDILIAAKNYEKEKELEMFN